MLRSLAHCTRVSAVLASLLGVALVGANPATAADASGMPRADAAAALQAPSGSTFALEHFVKGTDGASKEFGAARSDHAAIALEIGQCYHDKFGDPLKWSPSVRAILLFELDEHLMHTLLYINDTNGKEKPANDIPVLNSFHTAAISFSDRISRDRLEFRKELEANILRSYWYQIVIVSLGAGTTIFVSARAILQGTTAVSGAVGILAIILSAAGVAVSSMNTFEGSHAIVLRDQRALSQLQQLHWRVASDVLKQSAICNNPTVRSDDAMNMVDSWRSRLETILDSAVESISKPGDLSSGGVASPSAPGKRDQVSTAAIGR